MGGAPGFGDVGVRCKQHTPPPANPRARLVGASVGRRAGSTLVAPDRKGLACHISREFRSCCSPAALHWAKASRSASAADDTPLRLHRGM